MAAKGVKLRKRRWPSTGWQTWRYDLEWSLEKRTNLFIVAVGMQVDFANLFLS